MAGVMMIVELLGKGMVIVDDCLLLLLHGDWWWGGADWLEVVG